MWNITGTSPEPWTEHFVNVTYIYILWPFMHTHNAHRTCDTHSPTKRCDMQPQPNTTKTHTHTQAVASPGMARLWKLIFQIFGVSYLWIRFVRVPAPVVQLHTNGCSAHTMQSFGCTLHCRGGTSCVCVCVCLPVRMLARGIEHSRLSTGRVRM